MEEGKGVCLEGRGLGAGGCDVEWGDGGSGDWYVGLSLVAFVLSKGLLFVPFLILVEDASIKIGANNQGQTEALLNTLNLIYQPFHFYPPSLFLTSFHFGITQYRIQ